ncbi:hypothetical protein [Acutalibacter muris]|uniref:hypothetical protein n=1 Tax=Acutalibacter muris TaxID=1796620 RepID=UPI001C3EDCE4|nr:hypothetical protein [Acutalibacter muris]
MSFTRKERAATTANSNRPVKIKLHTNNSTKSRPQNQERISNSNGRVLRHINTQWQLYTSIKDITSDLRKDGISAKDICRSIAYLSTKGYISLTKNGEAVKMTSQGIRLLAGSVIDKNIAI